MAVRRFVLAPLAEVAPDAVDPMTGRTSAELLANLDRRPSSIVLFGEARNELHRRLAGRLATGTAGNSPWVVTAVDGPEETWPKQWLGAGTVVVEPTFLAATSPERYWQHRNWRALNTRSNAPARKAPLLWPGSETALRDHSHEELDRMEAEVVAACEATRSGIGL
jgi:hypothetical protein